MEKENLSNPLLIGLDMVDNSNVYISKCAHYENDMSSLCLPDEIFNTIFPGEKVVLKPNWVKEAHKDQKDLWNHVITHPTLIERVILKVLQRPDGRGRISILDGPVTDASFNKLINHYPVDKWNKLVSNTGVEFEIIDLRDHEWITKNDVTIKRRDLPGDPRGKVIVDVKGENSEFFGHIRSKRGYYGADYDRNETNMAHDGFHNLYSVSRTCIESDVFINIPKLKTHRKAGITCCLKNLVGINTYKNYLPHHNEGSPSEGGDQFPSDNVSSKIEGPLVSYIKQHFFNNQKFAFFLSPLNSIGKKIFGDSSKVIRNGSWYGNDTLWRMVLDLNKVLFYADYDGKMKSNPKRYIGIVDAVIAGEGEGPMSPDPVNFGYVICGANPVAIDTVCAYMMGFDPVMVPSIEKAFKIQSFPLCSFEMNKIKVIHLNDIYPLFKLPAGFSVSFVPQFGWKGHIEREI
jgi:uncharacterized protein (DUF362 family)